MRISVITPHYNMSQSVLATLASVDRQATYVHQHLVIDDCSEEPEFQKLQEMCRRFEKVELIRNPTNIGPIKTINNGALRADGDLLIFLSADDLIADGICEAIVKGFQEAPSAGIAFGDVMVDYGETKLNYKVRGLPFSKPAHLSKPLPEIAKSWKDPVHGASAIKKDLFFKYGPYDLELKWNSDLYLHLKIAKEHGLIYLPQLHHIFKKGVATYGSQGGNRSSTQFKTLDRLLELLNDDPELRAFYARSGTLGKEPNTLKYFLSKGELDFLTFRFFAVKAFFFTARLLRSTIYRFQSPRIFSSAGRQSG